MGTEIHGIIKHLLAIPPQQTLPAELSVAMKSKNPFLQGPWSWNIDALKNGTGLGLMRDGYTEISLGSKAAVLATGVGWFDAVREKRLRRNLLLAIFELARFFKSPSVILLPDDQDPWFSIRQTVFDNGASFQDVMQEVKQISEPCRTLRQAIQPVGGGSIDGYLVIDEPFLESDLLR